MWLGIGQFFNMALAFVSAAILSRYFDKTDYGTYRQVMYVYTSLTMIFTAGLPSVFAYFIPRYNEGQAKTLINKINRLFLLLGAAMSLVLFIGADFFAQAMKNPELSNGIKYFSIFPLFTFPAMGVEGIYTAIKRTKYIAIYQLINKSLMLLFIVAPVILFNGTYLTAIIGWGIASFLTFLVSIYLKNKPYKDVVSIHIPNIYRTILNYSVPLMGASCVGMLIYIADQFFISRYFGIEVFAEFSNGYISLPFVGMIAGSMKAVLLPIFSKASVDNSLDSAFNSYNNAVFKTAVLLFPLLFYCGFFAKDIMIFLYGDKYVTSSVYFQMSVIKSFFEVFPIITIILAIGKSKLYFYFHLIFALITWLTYYMAIIFIPSPIIIAILSVVLFVLLLFAFLLYLYFNLNIKLLSLKLGLELIKIILNCLIVISFVSLISALYFNQMHLIYKLLITISLFYVVLIPTGRIIKVDYLKSFTSIINKK